MSNLQLIPIYFVCARAHHYNEHDPSVIYESLCEHEHERNDVRERGCLVRWEICNLNLLGERKTVGCMPQCVLSVCRYGFCVSVHVSMSICHQSVQRMSRKQGNRYFLINLALPRRWMSLRIWLAFLPKKPMEIFLRHFLRITWHH